MADIAAQMLEDYAATVVRMADHRLWLEWRNLQAAAGVVHSRAELNRIEEFARIAEAELAGRNITSEPPLPEQGRLHFRPTPAATIDGRSAIEVWDGDRLAATLYVQSAGLHLVFETEYQPGRLTLEVSRPPMALQIPITNEVRSRRESRND